MLCSVIKIIHTLMSYFPVCFWIFNCELIFHETLFMQILWAWRVPSNILYLLWIYYFFHQPDYLNSVWRTVKAKSSLLILRERFFTCLALHFETKKNVFGSSMGWEEVTWYLVHAYPEVIVIWSPKPI